MGKLEVAPQQSFAEPTVNAFEPSLFPARRVPLGGTSGVEVERLLPQRVIPTVGAWCFLDHLGPNVSSMDLLPHPHIGLQTVTWLYEGAVRHRDSLGSDVTIQPGQLNLMTAGFGVAHSEFALSDQRTHGVQLWAALPDTAREGEATFQHIGQPVSVSERGVKATLMVGDFDGIHSTAVVYTPLVGVDISLDPWTTVNIPLIRDYEYAIVCVDGIAEVNGTDLPAGPLLFLGRGNANMRLRSEPGTRVLLIGGEPCTDELVMWWNFVGRSHEEIETARQEWEWHSQRFGPIPSHGFDRIPAPPMPKVRLKPRRRK